LNLDGTVVTSTDDWNQAYYGTKVLPPDILVRGSHTNKGAAALMQTLTKASAKR